MEEIKMHVDDLHCIDCMHLLEGRLKNYDGVVDVKVNLSGSSVYVKFDETKITKDMVRAIITKQIYSGESKKSGILRGFIFGLIPHIGCLIFILGSVFGVTFFMDVFSPLLRNRNFFFVLIFLSLFFTASSGILYLKRNKMLSVSGIKLKWKYLSLMFFSTILINIILFFGVFPLLANASNSQQQNSLDDSYSELNLTVDIPCTGHAPLITEELKKLEGVYNVKFFFPDIFNVKFNPDIVSKGQILNISIFKEYPVVIK